NGMRSAEPEKLRCDYLSHYELFTLCSYANMQKLICLSSCNSSKIIMRLSVFVGMARMTVGLVLAANPEYTHDEVDKTAYARFSGLPLAKALEQLQRQTGVPLAYQPSALPKAPAVTYSANKKVKTILTDVLAMYDLTYVVEDGFVLLKPQPQRPETAAPRAS